MIDRRKAYIYKMTDQKNFDGIALDCHMHKDSLSGKEMLWFDATGRPHMIEGSIVRETAQGFVFLSKGYEPGEWIFEELTIEAFRRKYYQIVEAGKVIAEKIRTTEDLHEWYRKNFHFPHDD